MYDDSNNRAHLVILRPSIFPFLFSRRNILLLWLREREREREREIEREKEKEREREREREREKKKERNKEGRRPHHDRYIVECFAPFTFRTAACEGTALSRPQLIVKIIFFLDLPPSSLPLPLLLLSNITRRLSPSFFFVSAFGMPRSFAR
jgi:hypothetical protein